MRNKLNNFTENLLRLTVLERVQQLEKSTENLNVLKKQLALTEVIDEVILRANKAPDGLVEVIFTDKKFKKDTPLDRIILNSTGKVGGFNIGDPESVNSLMKTVIVIDPMWSSNVTVWQASINTPYKLMKQ